IVGSRKFPNPHAIDAYVQTLPDDTIVISGGAEGADQIAEIAAKHRGLKTISIPVLPHEWDVVGKGAGMIRNQAIVDMAGHVVAFHTRNSPGTANTIERAKK